jgi:hypothetical protein
MMINLTLDHSLPAAQASRPSASLAQPPTPSPPRLSLSLPPQSLWFMELEGGEGHLVRSRWLGGWVCSGGRVSGTHSLIHSLSLEFAFLHLWNLGFFFFHLLTSICIPPSCISKVPSSLFILLWPCLCCWILLLFLIRSLMRFRTFHVNLISKKVVVFRSLRFHIMISFLLLSFSLFMVFPTPIYPTPTPIWSWPSLF